MKTTRAVLPAMAACILAACGDGASAGAGATASAAPTSALASASPAAAPGAAEAPPSGPIEVSVDGYVGTDGLKGGTVKGKLVLSGAPPAPRSMTINKDPEVCGTGSRLVGAIVVGAGGALSGGVAYIDGIASGKKWTLPAGVPPLFQEGCKFLPTSRVLPRGYDLPIVNKDAVFHNIHTYEIIGESGRNTMFNVGQPAGSVLSKSLRTKRKESHVMKLECDAHNFMHEWIFLASNPYFAVSAADGSFEITDVPPGKHVLRAWFPEMGTLEAEVEVGASGATTHEFKFGG